MAPSTGATPAPSIPLPTALSAPTAARGPSKALNVSPADVVKVVLQYLQEAGLSQSVETLQEETGVVLNTVTSMAQFTGDITSGRWDAVLKVVSTLKLPPSKVIDLYEQVAVEMVELGEVDTARALLHGTVPLGILKREQPDRYARLERLAASARFNDADVYVDGRGKEERRADIARALSEEVSVVPAARLVTLLGQAMKWQQHEGLLPPGSSFDLFRGAAPKRVEEVERPVTRQSLRIRFGGSSHAECAVFTPDGQHLITGSVDGFVEVWDIDTGKINKDLAFQAKDEFMMHDESVLCMACSDDSEMLATGSKDGMVKVWRIETGQCLRKLSRAHAQGVTCLRFASDGMRLLSGSFDQTARVHGLRGGKVLKEFRGHSSFINAVMFSSDGARVITGSSDGTVKVWDYKTSDCMDTLRPAPQGPSMSADVLAVAQMPRDSGKLVVVTRSSTVNVVTLKGDAVASFATGNDTGGDVLAGLVSPQGKFLYALAEDGQLYCFNMEKKTLQHMLEAHAKEPIGMVHHPSRNLVATFSDDGELKLWRP